MRALWAVLCIFIFALTVATLPGPAVGGEFERVEEFPEGRQTSIMVSAFLSGFEMSNSVERTYAAPPERLWAAVKRAAEELEKVGKRDIAQVNERAMRIQVGKISQDAASGLGSGGWLDEFVIEATKISDAESKMTVSRRVVQLVLKQRKRSLLVSGFDRELRSSKSNGAIESWVHTKVEDYLAAMAAGKMEIAPVAAAAQPKAEPKADGPEAQLAKLRELKEKGLISEDEYEAMRKRVLNAVVAPK